MDPVLIPSNVMELNPYVSFVVNDLRTTWGEVPVRLMCTVSWPKIYSCRDRKKGLLEHLSTMAMIQQKFSCAALLISTSRDIPL